MNREEAFDILKKYMTQEYLIKHCLAVEMVMRHFAKLNNENIEKWGIVGLLHDIDYEKYPEEHCTKCVEILKQEGISGDMIKSIQSHGYNIVVDVKPEHFMEKILYTIDELTGLVTAAALMQPNKTVEEVELKSLKKKFKLKGFAAKIDRELIAIGAEMTGLDLDYIMQETLVAMKEGHEALGL